MLLHDYPAYDEQIKSIYRGQIYNNTITNSKWLADQAVSPGRWAVGYEFLYVLYRALDEAQPNAILELGLGQSTKLTSQYAKWRYIPHTVVEQDADWINFVKRGWEFSPYTHIVQRELNQETIEGAAFYSYRDFSSVVEGKKFSLIIVDGPWGGDGKLSRRDILAWLPEILEKDFLILFDDCGRVGEWQTVNEAAAILQKSGLEIATGVYDGGSYKKTVAICSQSWKWLTSL